MRRPCRRHHEQPARLLASPPLVERPPRQRSRPRHHLAHPGPRRHRHRAQPATTTTTSVSLPSTPTVAPPPAGSESSSSVPAARGCGSSDVTTTASNDARTTTSASCVWTCRRAATGGRSSVPTPPARSTRAGLPAPAEPRAPSRTSQRSHSPRSAHSCRPVTPVRPTPRENPTPDHAADQHKRGVDIPCRPTPGSVCLWNPGTHLALIPRAFGAVLSSDVREQTGRHRGLSTSSTWHRTPGALARRASAVTSRQSSASANATYAAS